MSAREVIAKSTGMCEYAVMASSPHDHSRCLEEADQVIAALTRGGYEIKEITAQPNQNGGAAGSWFHATCPNGKCPCNRS